MSVQFNVRSWEWAGKWVPGSPPCLPARCPWRCRMPLGAGCFGCSLGQQPFLSPFCILGGRAASWEQGEGDVLHQTLLFSSGIRLVWGVHGAISTRPLASCGLNAQVPPASQPPGRNLKCFQHLGGSYAAGTEIWEQKEENNLCKRPWPAHDGEDKSVTGLPRKKSSCIQHSDKPNARKAYLKGSFEIK